MNLALDRFALLMESGKIKVRRDGKLLSCHIMEYDIPEYKVSVCAKEEFSGHVEYVSLRRARCWNKKYVLKAVKNALEWRKKMTITKNTENGVLTLALEGRLDTNTAPDLEKEISADLTDDVETLILDLKYLEYISSAGLRVLLAAQKKNEQAGQYGRKERK